jgi:hypothetical protein
MTRDDITRIAREAGFVGFDGDNGSLRRFAALVAAAERKRIESRPWGAGTEWIVRAVEAEREACARMAEAFHQHGYDFTGDLELHDAIRARGQV